MTDSFDRQARPRERRFSGLVLALAVSAALMLGATVARATGRVLGSTRFGNIEFWPWRDGNPHQRGAGRPDVVEIGWTWLHAEAQRTAINTEAKLIMLTQAFETWHVHAV